MEALQRKFIIGDYTLNWIAIIVSGEWSAIATAVVAIYGAILLILCGIFQLRLAGDGAFPSSGFKASGGFTL